MKICDQNGQRKVQDRRYPGRRC